MVIGFIPSLAVVCIFLLHSPAHAQLALPSNLHVAPMYREFVEAIADHSPTFEEQLMRIDAATGVDVHVAIVPRVLGARARTRMVRDGERLTAWIEVGRLDNVVELLAHEIEHVIEQMERVDLTIGARIAETGIYSVSVDGTSFETARAARAGVTVAREVARSKTQNPAC